MRAVERLVVVLPTVNKALNLQAYYISIAALRMLTGDDIPDPDYLRKHAQRTGYGPHITQLWKDTASHLERALRKSKA